MNNYTKVANQVLEDATLSLKAKGLFAYLVKLPEGWKIRIGEIAKHHRDGYDSVHSALNELLAAGYLERFGRSRDKGQVGDWQYHINTGLQPDREKPVQENPVQVKPDGENLVQVDLPQAQIESAIEPNRENPVQVKPDRGKPDQEKPDQENPDVYIKDLERKDLERKEKVKKEKSEKGEVADGLPDWVPKQDWFDFVKQRKAMRNAPWTPGSASRNLGMLKSIAAEYGEEHAIFCLNETIRQSWRGIPRIEPKSATQRYQSADEKNKKTLDNFLNEESNGKQGNDSAGTDRVFSQHRKDNTKRTAIRLVEGLQRRTG